MKKDKTYDREKVIKLAKEVGKIIRRSEKRNKRDRVIK